MFLHSYGNYDESKKQWKLAGVQPNIFENISEQPFEYVYTLTDNGYTMEMFCEKEGHYNMVLKVEAVRVSPSEIKYIKVSEAKEEAPVQDTRITNIHFVSLLVNDVDDALHFYVDLLKFVKVKDMKYGEDRRWVVIRAPKQSDFEITIYKANSEEEKRAVGKQAGDTVYMVINTDDIHYDYNRLKDHVNFKGEPKEQFWGTEVVFTDLYGNLIDLVQPKPH